ANNGTAGQWARQLDL
nr:valine sensitive acetolactate synthase large subunit, ALS, acetohydroxy acid synthase {N-terminal} {EC 4.1.3.18} [Serratia marcescens, ATCC 25419, Peptide Partial, 15 aa] [Serratia marcescens]